MTAYYLWFFLFAIVVYFTATDFSIAQAVNLCFRLLKFQYEKIKWWLLHNPRNPIIRYMIWRNSVKMAEELMKDLKKNEGI